MRFGLCQMTSKDDHIPVLKGYLLKGTLNVIKGFDILYYYLIGNQKLLGLR